MDYTQLLTVYHESCDGLATRLAERKNHAIRDLAVVFGLLSVVVLILAACVPVTKVGETGSVEQAPMVEGTATVSAQSIANGRQIYLTATSTHGTPITFQMPGSGMMGGMRGGPAGRMMACVTCHGPDGRGGEVQMMMGAFEVPDIRYQTLTEGEMDHAPYTDETIKRAITQGVDPAGQPLEWPMPLWSMSNQDLNDLLAFLKSLD